MNLHNKLPLEVDGDYLSVVEIPRGSNAKYEYNHSLGVFELDRCLVTAMNYPANYGFMPQTMAEDGDPLDCLIFTDVPLHSGTVVRGEAIAVLKMLDNAHGSIVQDYKILLIPKFNKRYESYKEIRKEYLDVYEDFFRNYKNLTSESIKILGWAGKEEAEYVIQEANQRFVYEQKGKI